MEPPAKRLKVAVEVLPERRIHRITPEGEEIFDEHVPTLAPLPHPLLPLDE